MKKKMVMTAIAAAVLAGASALAFRLGVDHAYRRPVEQVTQLAREDSQETEETAADPAGASDQGDFKVVSAVNGKAEFVMPEIVLDEQSPQPGPEAIPYEEAAETGLRMANEIFGLDFKEVSEPVSVLYLTQTGEAQWACIIKMKSGDLYSAVVNAVDGRCVNCTQRNVPYADEEGMNELWISTNKFLELVEENGWIAKARNAVVSLGLAEADSIEEVHIKFTGAGGQVKANVRCGKDNQDSRNIYVFFDLRTGLFQGFDM